MKTSNEERKRRFLFKPKNEKGSVTVFVLIAMLFFLTVGLIIFISNMNDSANQKKDYSKIQKDYNNVSSGNLNTIYDEQEQIVTGKIQIIVRDSDGNLYKGDEWTNKEPLTVEVIWPKEIKQNTSDGKKQIVIMHGVTPTTYNENQIDDIELSDDGIYNIFAQVNDNKAQVTVKIDSTAPTATFSPDGGTEYINPTTRKLLEPVEITAQDPLSGVNKIEYIISTSATEPSLDDTNWKTYTGKIDEFPDAEDGDTYYVYAKVTDNVGNVDIIPSKAYHILDARATFDTGTNVNVKMKTLAGNTGTITHETADELITKIVLNVDGEGKPTIPSQYRTDEYKVSAADSKLPIYMWAEDDPENEGKKIIKWFTDDTHPFMNADGSHMFDNLYATASIPELNIIDTSKATTMASLFKDCRALTSIDLSNFDTARVTDMSYMFHDCVTLTTLDVSSLETQNVTTMAWMFAGDNSNNTGTNQLMKLTSITGLTNFNTAKVTDMDRMFYLCTNMASVDVSSFDTSKVTIMSYMFGGAYPSSGQIYVKFAEIRGIENFNTSNVEKMNGMFGLNSQLTSLDLSKWNTSKVTNMTAMFWFMTKLENLNISNFDTSKVTDMHWMFWNSNKLTELDLRSFDTSKVNSMNAMFSTCNGLKTIYATDSFVVKSGADTTNMFNSCSVLEGGSGTKYSVAGVKNGSYAKIDGKGAPGYFTNHYFIEFNANDGTQDPAKITQGIPFSYATNLRTNTFTKEGYIFRGWSKTEGGAVAYTDGQSMNYDLAGIKNEVITAADKADDKNVTLRLYAVWSQVHYNVTYGSPAVTKPAETLAEAVSIAETAIDGTTIITATITPTMDYVDNSYKTSAAQGVLISKNITIDTKGYKITMANTITVASTSTTTFVDSAETKGKLERTTGDLITNNGTVTVNGGILESKNIVINGQTVNVLDGTVNNTGVVSGSANNARAINARNVTVSGGTVSCSTAHSIQSTASTTITGGNITSKLGVMQVAGQLNISGNDDSPVITGTNYGIWFGNSQNPIITISGGKVISTSGVAIKGEGTGKATIIITGGTVKGKDGAISLTNTKSKIVIGNSTTDINKNIPVIQSTNGYSIELATGSTLEYYDGKLIGKNHDKTYDGRDVTFNVTEANVTPRIGYKPYTRSKTENNVTTYETVLEKEMTLTVDAGSGAIKQANEWTVSADGWTVAQDGKTATKQVLQNTAYGSMPTVAETTRLGYTFKGWNGKNLLEKSTIYMVHTATRNISLDNMFFIKAGTYTYTLTVNNVSGYRDAIIMKNANGQLLSDNQYNPNSSVGYYYNASYGTWIIGSDKQAGTRIIPITIKEDCYIRFVTMFGTESASTEIISQLEQGSTATAYEPYYITDSTTVVRDTDHTLNAVWSLNTYNITYNLDGGTNNANNPSTYTVESADITLQDPIKEGYVFRGWTGNGTTTPTKNLVLPHGSTEDKTYTANWSQVHYTIAVGTENLVAETLEEAISLAEAKINGTTVTTATITATMDYTDNSTATISKNIVLDLAGHTITRTANIVNEGTLDIYSSADNGKITGSLETFIVNKGTFTANGTSTEHSMILENTSKDARSYIISHGYSEGTIIINANATLQFTNPIETGTNDRYIITNRGTTTINGATLKTSENGTSKEHGVYIPTTGANGRIIINDGTTINTTGIAVYNNGSTKKGDTPAIEIHGDDSTPATTTTISSTKNIAIDNEKSGEVKICSGTISSDGYSSVYNNTTGIINVLGGLISSTSGYAINNNSSGTINVTGGTISGEHGIYNAADGTINVSGESTRISGTKSSGQGIRGNAGTVNIYNGEITGTIYGVSVNTAGNKSGTIIMKGGKVTGGRHGLLAASSGTSITIGENEGGVPSKTLPEVISIATSGKYYGVYKEDGATFNFYDGIVTGYTGHSLNAQESSKPDGYQVVKRTADGKETAVLEKEVIVTADAGEGAISTTNGWTIAQDGKTATKNVLQNVEYGTLPTANEMTRTGYTFKNWTGKNMFDIGNNDDYYFYYKNRTSVNNDGIEGTITNGAMTYWRNKKNKFKPGTYSISAIFTNCQTRHIIYLYDNNNNLLDNSTINITGLTYNNVYRAWYTNSNPIGVVIPNEVSYWEYGGAIIGITDQVGRVSNIQIEEGTTATSYEPYRAIESNTVVTSDTDHKIYANWTANTYQVTFDPNGGSVIPTFKPVTYDSTYDTLPIPTRDGYTFDGWYKENTFQNKVEANTIVKTADNHTLIAKWTANTYKIKFNANGGTGEMADLDMTYDTAKNLTSNAFTKTGYSFVKWTTNADGTGDEYTNNQSVNNLTTENGTIINLYAQWEANPYTVTFNAKGGTVNPTSKTVTYDSAYGELPSGENITRIGYTFDGWYKEEAYTNKVEATTIVNTASNHTLYAKWTANNYTIHFNANGGTGTMADEAMTYDVDKALTKNTFTKTGYTFIGWSQASTGFENKLIYSNNEEKYVGNNLITADKEWIAYEDFAPYFNQYGTNAKYRLEYDIMSENTSNVNYMTVYLQNGSSSKYVFAANTDPNNRVYNSGRVHQLIVSDTEWTHDTLEFRVEESDLTQTKALLAFFGQYNTDNKPRVKNVRLYIIPDYTDEQVVSNLTSEPNGEVTLYAVWQANPYVVTANANGGTIAETTGWTGSGESATKTVTYDSAYGALPEVSRTGYTFNGWSGKNLLNLSGRTVQNFGAYDSSTVRKFSGNGIYKGATANNYYNSAAISSYEIDSTNNNVTVNSAVSGYGIGFDVKVKPNTKYTISKGASSQVAFRIGEYSSDGSYIKFRVKSESSYTFTTSENTYWLLIVVSPDVASQHNTSLTNYNIQLEEGGAATAYEPYKTITADTIVQTDCNHNIHANWTAIPYTISYELNGGTVLPANPTTYNIETSTFTLNNPTKDGYVFIGWTGSNGETRQTTVTVEKGSYGNKTYTANWGKLTLSKDTIFVNASGAETIAKEGTTAASTAQVTYTVEGTNALEFTSQNTDVATVETTDNIVATVTGIGVTDGGTTKIIFTDKTTGVILGELNVKIDITPPDWLINFASVLRGQ